MNKFFVFLLGLFIGICLMVIFMDLDQHTIDVIKTVSFLFVGVSGLIATRQLSINADQAKLNAEKAAENTTQIQYTNNWNKRQLAAVRVYESRKSIKQSISELHKALDIIESGSNGKTYEVYEIHNALGVFLNNGEFIFHGEETEDDVKNLPKDSEQLENHINNFKKDINGRCVKDKILDILGEYEYLAMNVNNNETFDRETIKLIMGGVFIKNYRLFRKYIDHLRSKHHGGNLVYKEFETFTKALADEKGVKL